MPEITDNTTHLDQLVVNAMRAGASAGLMEAHRLLCMRGQKEAADALALHWDSIANRAAASYHAQRAIDRARVA